MSEQHNLKSGERRHATILFSDMKGFTSLSERLDPEDMDALMSSVFASFEGIIRAHGGTVEKYIGDALVAVFGVPNIHEDDPARAVSAALAFGRELRRINESLKDKTARIEFRSGIHTGLVTTGRRGAYDVVTGHAMSVAARLETEAPVGGVLVSAATRERCEHDFMFDAGHLLTLKGKEEVITAYRVLGRNPNPMFGGSHFANREHELEHLTRTYLRHDPEGTGGFILTGQPGLGKTRLAGRFIEQIKAFPGFGAPILTARARRYRDLNFAVVIDLLLTYFPFEASEDSVHIREQTQELLSVDAKTAQGFADLVQNVDSTTSETQSIVVLFAIFKAILEKHANSAFSALIVIDNVSVLDEESRDFLRFFLENSRIKPFFLFTGRKKPELIEDILRDVETLKIEPLSTPAATELIDTLWPECSNIDLKNAILNTAKGNPLFIEEYVRYARDSHNLDLSTVPTTIQNIFLSMIDTFAPDMRELLTRVSAFVESFTAEDAAFVQRRADGSTTVIPEALGLFLQEGILVANDGHYSFRYDVFRNALYDSLLNHNKRILHRIIADRMKQQETPHMGRLLHHLIQAEAYEEAGATLLGVHDLHLNLAYIPFIETLLQKLPADERTRRLRFMFAKSAISINNGDMRETDIAVREMLDIAMNEHEIEYAASAFHLMCGHHRQNYNFEKARICGETAIEYYTTLVQTEADSGGPAHTRHRHLRRNVFGILTVTESLAADRDAARAYLRRVEADCANHGDCETAETATIRASYYLLFGEYTRGMESVRPYVEPYEAEPELSAHEAIYVAMLLSRQLCDYEAVIALAGKLAKVPEASYPNRQTHLSQVHSMLAEAYFFLDQAQRATEHLRQAEFHQLQIRSDLDRIDALRSLASAAMILGDTEHADRFSRQCISLGMRHGAYYPAFSALVVLAELLQSREDSTGRDFFLMQASYYVATGFGLPRRDLVIYYHLRAVSEATRAPGGQSSCCETFQQQARALIQAEVGEMTSERHVKRLLMVRTLGNAYHSYLTADRGRGTSGKR
ncbi:MAG: adenylate/guanylate cyclase domain-containing protein [Spirochaetaceae bacterium]